VDGQRSQGLFVAWYRCALDGHEHAVGDEEFAAGAYRQQGRYRAVCGHEVTVDSVLVEPGAACPQCQADLYVWGGVLQESGRHRKSGPSRWLRWQPSRRRIAVRRASAPPGALTESCDGANAGAGA
jgi:hypothetical protein